MNFNYKKNAAGLTLPACPVGRLNPTKPLRNNLTGFTLMETLVVISITVIFLIISSDFITQGFRSGTFIYEQDAAVQNTRKAQDTMVKEIRKANQAENGEYLLDTVLPQTLTFYSDADSDGLTEKVRYFLDNHDLKRGLTHATGSPLNYPAGNEKITILTNYLNNQANPLFFYYDKNNALIADPTTNKKSIRLIEVSAQINVTPERAPQNFNLEADVQIRNLKDNL